MNTELIKYKGFSFLKKSFNDGFEYVITHTLDKDNEAIVACRADKELEDNQFEDMLHELNILTRKYNEQETKKLLKGKEHKEKQYAKEVK